MKPLVIAVDVDEVCFPLLKEWLRRYRVLSGDESLTHETVRGWDLAPQVLPSWRSRIYDILRHDDLYDHIEPCPGAVSAVKQLREAGHRAVFVTSCVVDSVDVKVRRLQKHRFLPEGRTQPDFIAATSKYLIRADVLIDDHVKNCEEFPGEAILIRCPHNSEIAWHGKSANSLAEAAVALLGN